MRREPIILVLLCACGGDGDDADGSLRVTGQVLDFESRDPIDGSISASTRGLEPPPVVTLEGSSYTLDGVTPNSVFHLLAAAAPTHRATYGDAIEVTDEDRDSVDVAVVSEDYLAGLADAFAVEPSAAGGVLFAHAVDDAGRGRAGVTADAFVTPPGAVGPYFLDAELAPDPDALETSSSGWAIFFEVDPGVIALEADPASGVTLEMATSPVAPAAATIATVRVIDGAEPLPTNVSFSADVVPIFETRGCQACHSGSGPGRDLGNLTLDGSANLVYRELVEEAALAPGGLRIDTQDPALSLVLTMPSAEEPADDHPNVTFTGPTDPDYRTILAWITEGALEN